MHDVTCVSSCPKKGSHEWLDSNTPELQASAVRWKDPHPGEERNSFHFSAHTSTDPGGFVLPWIFELIK